MSSSSSIIAASSSSSSSLSSMRHGSYYFEDGNTILLVGDVLFRLHRSILSRNSTLFRSMLSLPQAEGGTEGTIDSNPIVLSECSPHDFELLLDMIYSSATSTMEKNMEEWKSILDIAHRLEVEWIHERAFAEMARFPLNPVDKVVIAQRFDDKRHLVREAYVELVRRDGPLSIDEAQRIGLVDATRLAQAREMFRDSVASSTSTPTTPVALQQPPHQQQTGPRGGVLRRATTAAARHAPYVIPTPFSQPQGQQMHSIAHGLASSLAPVLASSSNPGFFAHGPASQSPLHQQMLRQHQQLQYIYHAPPPQPPQPPPSGVSGVAPRLVMPYVPQPDADAYLQAVAEHCVDAVFGFFSSSS